METRTHECNSGWRSVIEVHEGGRVVEVRQYGEDVLADSIAYERAWRTTDRQIAYEAVQPCPECRPAFVAPADRGDEAAEARREKAAREAVKISDEEQFAEAARRRRPYKDE